MSKITTLLKVCDSLMAEVQTGATVDLTPILPKPDPPTLAKSFSRDAPLLLQEAEEVGGLADF